MNSKSALSRIVSLVLVVVVVVLAFVSGLEIGQSRPPPPNFTITEEILHEWSNTATVYTEDGCTAPAPIVYAASTNVTTFIVNSVPSNQIVSAEVVTTSVSTAFPVTVVTLNATGLAYNETVTSANSTFTTIQCATIT
jgi:hypothetical protein